MRREKSHKSEINFNFHGNQTNTEKRNKLARCEKLPDFYFAIICLLDLATEERNGYSTQARGCKFSRNPKSAEETTKTERKEINESESAAQSQYIKYKNINEK